MSEASSGRSKYLQKKIELEQDDAALPPHYRALLEVQHRWFAASDYSEKEDLLAAVLVPGPAQDFARYFLALRSNPASRLLFSQFLRDIQQKGLDDKGHRRHYWKALTARFWDLYQSTLRMPSL